MDNVTLTQKIIIDNRADDIPMCDALLRVAHVVGQGRISETSKGKQYCFITTWTDGTIVYADKNKNSDRFVITKEEKKCVNSSVV
ncbi:MAG: hypothetical protein GY782_08640 [Gammaproteobacteria bacterium]|nr:hypothetical protein [Gammaproteobacteria bacterium]